jgi:hypothetical protein
VKRGILIAAGVVLVLGLGSCLAIGPIANGKVRDAADKRALSIAHDGVAYRFTHAEVRNATITAKGSNNLTVRAPTMDAKLQMTTPTWVIIPRAEVAITGSVDDVLKAIEPVRKADAALPATERVPIDVQGGTLKWKEPLGAGSSVSFGSLIAELRPKELLMHFALKNGKVELPQLTLGGLAVDLTRSTSSGEKLDLRVTVANEDGHLELVAHDHDADKDVDLTLEGFSLGEATPKVPGLDLSKAAIDGTAHGEQDHGGAFRSNGKLTFSKLRLPPIKAGPVSLSVGGTVKVTWRGSPKKGSPGTMTLDDAKIEVTLGGKTRVVKVRGDVAIGRDAQGPYLVNLTWEAGPFACAEIAGDLAGPLAKGLVAGSVSGNVNAKGTLKGDVTELASLKQSVEILEGCNVDVGKGLGDMLKTLPF